MRTIVFVEFYFLKNCVVIHNKHHLAATCASDWFAVINFNMMGPGSAFYNDYTNAEVMPTRLVKTAQETDSEFVKRCLGLCGADCNLVKVEHNREKTGECLDCPEINCEFLRLIKF